MNLELQAGMAGRYKLTKYKADEDGNPIWETAEDSGWFNNLITNQGLNRIGTANDWLSYCQVGIGSTAPANTDTSLATFLVGTTIIFGNTLIGAQGSAPYYAYFVRTYQFGVGVAAGTLAEIGIGWAASGATLYSRALILDGAGVPTTITILSDEILHATYEHRCYPPTVDTGGTFAISGVTYTYVARASQVTSGSGSTGWYAGNMIVSVGASTIFSAGYTGALGAITTTPSGSTASCTSQTAAAYGVNNLYRDINTVWGIGATNIGSYATAVIQTSIASFQLSFSPSIPKTTINELTLVVRISWTRAVIP